MKQDVAVLNVIIDRAIANVQGCINNVSDINRATNVGEKAWHIRKYTVPLATDKANLEEDLQLISNVASDSKVTIFGSESDYQKFDDIITAWSNLAPTKVAPLRKIKEILTQIKVQVSKR